MKNSWEPKQPHPVNSYNMLIIILLIRNQYKDADFSLYKCNN